MFCGQRWCIWNKIYGRFLRLSSILLRLVLGWYFLLLSSVWIIDYVPNYVTVVRFTFLNSTESFFRYSRLWDQLIKFHSAAGGKTSQRFVRPAGGLDGCYSSKFLRSSPRHEVRSSARRTSPLTMVNRWSRHESVRAVMNGQPDTIRLFVLFVYLSPHQVVADQGKARRKALNRVKTQT